MGNNHPTAPVMLALSVCECQPTEEHVPTYQYRCTACGHQFDAVQSFSDASLTTCPVCSGTLRKVFSPVGIVFKGSGFYRTDSRSGPSTVPGGDSSKSGGDTAAKNGAAKEAAAKDGGSAGGSGGKGGGSTSGSGSTSSSPSSSSTPATAAS